ncbi:hypothetical protein SAY86_000154 [Trapa natans]|uniref:Pentatricopeptide repeat-containing protein n=1 Tax=Trapa natans TaxID=22666 RepID=A0AAN7MX51_TRANT|nr:hypothetical protein SAY86_000154 [Trapa natans]
MISVPTFLRAAAAPPVAYLGSHHHTPGFTLRNHHHEKLILLHPRPEPSSLRQPEEPSIDKDVPPRPRTLPTKIRPWRKTSTADVLRLMDALSLPVPLETYSSLVKECAVLGDSEEALELHRHLKRSGLRPSLDLLNRLLLMLVSFGCMRTARQMFDEMPQRNFLTWSILFAAFMECGDYDQALRVFRGIFDRFRSSEVPSWMVVCILKACSRSKNFELGKQVHGWILKNGASNNKPIPISLINFYGTFRSADYAKFVFDQLPSHGAIIWTAKISSGSRTRRFTEVVSDFREMGRSGARVNISTISNALKASGRMKDEGDCGKQIHANVIKVGMDTHEPVQRGLVNMYANNGLLINARRVYDEMAIDKRKNMECSIAMLKTYLHNGFSVEAIKLLYQMKAKGIRCPESLLDKIREQSGS